MDRYKFYPPPKTTDSVLEDLDRLARISPEDSTRRRSITIISSGVHPVNFDNYVDVRAIEGDVRVTLPTINAGDLGKSIQITTTSGEASVTVWPPANTSINAEKSLSISLGQIYNITSTSLKTYVAR